MKYQKGSAREELINFYSSDEAFKERPDHRQWYRKDHLDVFDKLKGQRKGQAKEPLIEIYKERANKKFGLGEIAPNAIDDLIAYHDLEKAVHNENPNISRTETFGRFRDWNEMGPDRQKELLSGLDQMEHFKKTGTTELLPGVSNSAAKAAAVVSTLDAVSHYTPGDRGFLNIFANVTKPDMPMEEVMASNAKKLEKDKRKMILSTEAEKAKINLEYEGRTVYPRGKPKGTEKLSSSEDFEPMDPRPKKFHAGAERMKTGLPYFDERLDRFLPAGGERSFPKPLELEEDHPLRKISELKRSEGFQRISSRNEKYEKPVAHKFRQDPDDDFYDGFTTDDEQALKAQRAEALQRRKEGKPDQPTIEEINRRRNAKVDPLFRDLEAIFEPHKEAYFAEFGPTSKASPITQSPDPIGTVTDSTIVGKVDEPLKVPATTKGVEGVDQKAGAVKADAKVKGTKLRDSKGRFVKAAASTATSVPQSPAGVFNATTPPISSSQPSSPVLPPAAAPQPDEPSKGPRSRNYKDGRAPRIEIISEGAPEARRIPSHRKGRPDEVFYAGVKQADHIDPPILAHSGSPISKPKPSVFSKIPRNLGAGAIVGGMIGGTFAGNEDGQKIAGISMGALGGAGFASIIENAYNSQNRAIQKNYLSSIKGIGEKVADEQRYMGRLEQTAAPLKSSPIRDYEDAVKKQNEKFKNAAPGSGVIWEPEIPPPPTSFEPEPGKGYLAIIPNREDFTISRETAKSMRQEAQAVRRSARTTNKMVTAGLAAAAVVATAGIGLSFSGGDKSSGINSKRGL